MLKKAGSVVVGGKEYDLAGGDDEPAPASACASASITPSVPPSVTPEADWGAVIAGAAAFLKTYKLNADATDEWRLLLRDVLLLAC